MPDLYAYRMSNEMAAAYRTRCAERHAHRQAMAARHAELYPHNELVVSDSPFGLDRQPCGFADDAGDVPPGLSRAQTRTYLRPKRGKAGDYWRGILREAAGAPSVDEVFRAHQAEMHVLDVDRHRNFRVGVTEAPGSMFVVCGAELPESPHLTAVPLSEYYAAVEGGAKAVSSA